MSNIEEEDGVVLFERLSLASRDISTIKSHEFRRQTDTYRFKTNNDNDKSFKIIEAHSVPNISSKDLIWPPMPRKPVSNPNSPSKTDNEMNETAGHTFLGLEEMQAVVCDTEPLSNTTHYVHNDLHINCGRNRYREEKSHNTIVITEYSTRIADDDNNITESHSNFSSSAKAWDGDLQHNLTSSPISVLEPKKPFMKGHKSKSKLPSTSSKRKYDHILSPVAFYINKSPIVPLRRNVYPRKHPAMLPSTSSVQKNLKLYNKENVHAHVSLPSVAYCTAKATKIIDLPRKFKLPECKWAKKLLASIPNPDILKHIDNTCRIPKPMPPHDEDSLIDISVHQADLSICTRNPEF